MTNPFDFVNAINVTKEDLIKNAEIPELEEKSYSPFLTNRALSYFLDTVMYANEINLFSNLDNKMQFDYYINTIRSKKRFSKWSKVNNSVDLEFIMEYYDYSRRKAREVLKILSKEEIKQLKASRQKGGADNDS